MEEKLINFLKQNKVYRKFMRNIGDDTIPQIIARADMVNKPNIVTPIITAFVWGLTPEGIKFWSNVNHKWITNTKQS